MITRRKFISTLAATITILSITAPIANAGKAKIYSDASTGIAINGYDPVAYFTQSSPVKGKQKFSTKWNGAIWQFSNAENLATFESDPEKYAPQYGGYCAFAVSYGSTATTSPQAWSIVDGKLYLNYSLGVRKRWSKDIAGNISKANANWPGVLQ